MTLIINRYKRLAQVVQKVDNAFHRTNRYSADSVICFVNRWIVIYLGQVVQKVDKAIHRINHYPADGVVCFVNVYPLDSDLSGE